jgi:hypothetical protein
VQDSDDEVGVRLDAQGPVEPARRALVQEENWNDHLKILNAV